MSMLGGGGGAPGMGMGGPGSMGMGGENPLAALLAQMGGGGAPGANPLGITSGASDFDPDSLGGLGGNGNEDPMAAMFKAMSSGAGGPGGALPPGLFGGDANNPNPLFPSSQPLKKPLIQRIFPFIHVIAMVALWAFIVLWWEPSLHPSSTILGSGRPWTWSNLAKYGLLSGNGEGGKFRNLERDLERQTRFATLVSYAVQENRQGERRVMLMHFSV
jgi:hypothetical protein